MSIPPQANRRNFFSSGFQSFLEGIADVADLGKTMGFLGFDKSYVCLKRNAMATDFEIYIPHYEKTEMRKVAMKALDEIERIERVLSIWQGETELMDVNARAAKEPVQVSPEIYNLVKMAKRLFSQSNGAYDITSTPLSKCWGFFYREGRLPSEEEIKTAREKVGMHHVKLNDQEHTIFFEKDGIEINPGSIGKGFALDCAMRVAHAGNLDTVLMHGGFSSILASGHPAWKDAWQIDVRNPLDHENPLARMQLKEQGFSSSGSELQNFEINGKTYGHIIDPRTGWPAEEALNVNVVANTAAEAEAFSTAFYVMGVEKTLEYCENHPHVGVLILWQPNGADQPEVVHKNIPEDYMEVLVTS